MQISNAAMAMSAPNPTESRTVAVTNVHSQPKNAAQFQTHQRSGTDVTVRNQTPPHIVYDVDKHAHRIWLNVVDPKSGQILLKLPPQAVRNIVDSLAAKRTSVDTQS